MENVVREGIDEVEDDKNKKKRGENYKSNSSFGFSFFWKHIIRHSKTEMKLISIAGTIILFCLILRESECLKDNDVVLRVKGQSFYPFLSFVFDSSGIMRMSIKAQKKRLEDTTKEKKVDENLMSFSLCTQSQYRALVNNIEGDVSSICLKDFSTKCELDKVGLNDSKLSYHEVKGEANYIFLVANCDAQVRTFTLSYELLNQRGTSQLAVGDGPLPDVYLAFTLVWAFIFLSMLFEVFLRRRTYKNVLHYLLGGVLLLKIFVVACSLAYWRICQRTGYCYDLLQYLQSFLFALSESSFFSVLLLISKGYKITRPSLPRDELRDVSVALMLLLCALLFFSFYNPGYYLLSLMIMYFFLLPKIFNSISQNVHALRAQILMLEEVQRVQNRDALASFRNKLRVFQFIRNTVVVYLLAILAVSIFRMLVGPYNLDWLNYFINELVSLCMVLVVIWIVRPQPNLFVSEADEDIVDAFNQRWENNLDQLLAGMLGTISRFLSLTTYFICPKKRGRPERAYPKVPQAT